MIIQARDHPAASIFLAGDFNLLPDDAISERTGLSQIVRQPTRGANIFDRIHESCPTYSTVRVVNSLSEMIIEQCLPIKISVQL